MVRHWKWYFFSAFWVLLFSCKQNQTDQAGSNLNTQDSTSLMVTLDSSLYRWEDGKILVNWKDLLEITFIRQAHPILDSVDIPQFNQKVKALNGRDVIIEGFYIPVEETGDENIVILSAFPFAECFFCGQAGVESIVDVLIKEKLPPIKTDTKVRFSGKFKTNADDFDYLIYLLEDPVYIK